MYWSFDHTGESNPDMEGGKDKSHKTNSWVMNEILYKQGRS